MKHQTPTLPKFKKLKRRLAFTRDREVIGLLESLWILTQKSAPRGDIGRQLDDEDIAIELEWDGEASELIDALVETRWLDRCEQNRLIVHDWAAHAPRYVHGIVAKKGGFALSTTVEDYSQGLQSSTMPTIVDQYSQGQPNLTQPNVTKPNLSNDAAHQSYPPEFEQFWKAYPVNAKGRKVGKKASLALWRKIPASDRGLLVEAATAYAREQTEFVRDPERFLKADYWRDFTTPAEKPVRKSRVATAEDLANWSAYGDYE